jgi:hypothetical protein
VSECLPAGDWRTRGNCHFGDLGQQIRRTRHHRHEESCRQPSNEELHDVLQRSEVCGTSSGKTIDGPTSNDAAIHIVVA